MERGCGLWIDDAGKIDKENDVIRICGIVDGRFPICIFISRKPVPPFAGAAKIKYRDAEDLLYSLRFLASLREISSNKSNKKTPLFSGVNKLSGWRQPEY